MLLYRQDEEKEKIGPNIPKNPPPPPKVAPPPPPMAKQAKPPPPPPQSTGSLNPAPLMSQTVPQRPGLMVLPPRPPMPIVRKYIYHCIVFYSCINFSLLISIFNNILSLMYRHAAAHACGLPSVHAWTSATPRLPSPHDVSRGCPTPRDSPSPTRWWATNQETKNRGPAYSRGDLLIKTQGQSS